jgi:hypothetical protein
MMRLRSDGEQGENIERTREEELQIADASDNLAEWNNNIPALVHSRVSPLSR